MLENSLNIGGSEWMIIIFVAIVLVLGKYYTEYNIVLFESLL